MAAARQIGFIGPSYTLRSVNVDCQRCVNLYPEINELGTGKNREVASLLGTPGLVRLTTFASSPVRGLFQASNGKTYAASGTDIYDITTPTSPTLLSSDLAGAGAVGMAENGVHLLIVDGVRAFVVNLSTNVVTQITDADFPPGADVAGFLDQYLIVNEPGTSRFWYSSLADATSWDGLDFASAEGAPDKLLTLLVDHRELWLFGQSSIEVFFNSGDPDSPIQRVQGAFIEHGIAAKRTARKMDNQIYWLGADENGGGMVYRAEGFVARRISTHAVEEALRSYGDISAGTAFTYQAGGHSFYVLNAGGNTTWVFDAATGLWHERTYTPATGAPMQRHRAEYHCFNGSQHLVGDYENGNLYLLSETAYDDDGAPITALRRWTHTADNGRRLTLRSMQIDMETGVGLASGQGSDPQVMFRYSKDGGHTWSNELWASAGKQGEYGARVIWRKMGEARDWVREISMTDPVKRCFISEISEFEAAAH